MKINGLFSRRRVIIGGITLALVVGLTLGLQAHDPKLDNADAALEKAMILLMAAECPTFDLKVQDECTKEIERAVRSIERAREHVAAAALVSDSITPAQ
jgi:hypothetical protein